ncbi:MAG: DUF507 family protein [Candidatus Schekmanbacteria bacterium]|nr:DUF507 family protein [Candidatus Schekmanbacteria bacterium]
MRLSEDKINDLAHTIARLLSENPRVTLRADKNDVRLRVKHVLTQELRVDEEVDAAVQRLMSSRTKKLQEGSRDWELEYERLFDQEMSRRRR